jgi:hypothetical protein
MDKLDESSDENVDFEDFEIYPFEADLPGDMFRRHVV